MSYVPNTSVSDAVLGPVTFTPWAKPSPLFTMTAHVLGPMAVRVTYTDPVDDTALDPAFYTIVALPGPPAYVPPIASVSFYDSDRKSVVVWLATSLTYRARYSLLVGGVFSYYGNTSLLAYTFTASVPDPPRAVDAVLAGNGFVDVVFDRPVGPYTIAATGVLAATGLPPDSLNSYNQASLASIPWSVTIPDNNVRFAVTGVPTLAGPPTIAFSGVKDVSYNVSNGTVALTVGSPPTLPYSFGSVLAARVVDAFVDGISDGPGGPGRALVNVFFNRPMLAADVTDPLKWTVNQQGFHPLDDTWNVAGTSPYPGLLNLLAFCTSFQSSFDGHSSQLLLHLGLIKPPDWTAVIVLAADLRAKLNAHVVSLSVHLSADIQDVVANQAPATEAQAMAVLNSVKASFDAHRVSAGKHIVPDTDYPIVSAAAVDLDTAAVLADELRSKFLSHESGTDYHIVQDSQNFPSAQYVLGQILSLPPPATLKEAARLVEEAQSKFVAHGLGTSVHPYPDTIHTGGVVPSVGQLLADVQASAQALQTAYNAHLPKWIQIPGTFPVVIRDRASSSAAVMPTDGMTYFAQLEVPADSSIPAYRLSCNIRSEDLSSTTSFLDPVTARPGFVPPRLLSVQTTPHKIVMRFDKGVDYPDLTKLSVTGRLGSRPAISATAVRPSLSSLFLFVTDLMEAYRYHNLLVGGAGHKVQDTINFLLNSEFPIPTVASVSAALNRLRDVYDRHAVSTVYHVGPDPNPVGTPYASDFDSSIALAFSISEALARHNVNVGVHLYVGADYTSHPLYDTVEVGAEGFREDEDYLLTMEVKGFFKDAKNGSMRTRSWLELPFRGKSYLPYLASVHQDDGVVYTAAGVRLVRDQLVSYFSKPMLPTETVSGGILVEPAGPVMGKSVWTGQASMSTEVAGMAGVPYSIEAVGFQDKFGNQVGRFIPPEFLLPALPQTFVLGPYTVGPGGYKSIHYRNDRPAIYFSIEAVDYHVVLLKAISFLPFIEVYLYDQDLNEIGSAPAGTVCELVANLQPSRYVMEVTVQNPLDVGTFTASVQARFDGSVGVEGIYKSYFGAGTVSGHVPGGYATYVSFVANAVITYVNVKALEGGYVFVWVMSDRKNGPDVGYGSGSSPEFQIACQTSIGVTYFVEVASGNLGPHEITVRPSDFP